MLRVGKLTDYATVILSIMAKDKHHVFAAMEMAALTGIALPTVSKVLKILVNAKILMSVRGAKGGYLLAGEPNGITVAAIISALEGPIALTECSLSKQACTAASGCGIRANWHVINQTIYNALASVTLADLIKPAVGLEEAYVPLASLYQ